MNKLLPYTILLPFVLLFNVPVASQSLVVGGEFWAVPRSAKLVADNLVVQQLMKSYLAVDNAKLEIRYPGGEVGLLQASELHDWLVALGVESDHIVLTPGSAVADGVEVLVQTQ